VGRPLRPVGENLGEAIAIGNNHACPLDFYAPGDPSETTEPLKFPVPNRDISGLGIQRGPSFKDSAYSIFGVAGMAEQRVPGSFAGT